MGFKKEKKNMSTLFAPVHFVLHLEDAGGPRPAEGRPRPRSSRKAELIAGFAAGRDPAKVAAEMKADAA